MGIDGRDRGEGVRPYVAARCIARVAPWALLVLGAILGGCEGLSRPNLVLITVDTLRADRLDPYGYRGTHTPNIARLAHEGILFERAFSDTSWTLPSVVSVLTGTYPFAHGVLTHHERLAEEQTTVAELLRDSGYHTAAIIASFPLDRRFGLSQGFESYDDDMTVPLMSDAITARLRELWRVEEGDEVDDWILSRLGGDAYRSDPEVAQRAVAWLGADPPEPFFLWIHFFGPHEKEAISRGESPGDDPRRRMLAAYDRDVDALDVQLGAVLDQLDVLPAGARTVIIFHSDHGQTLGEHSLMGHGWDLFDSTVHVPLIIRLPGRARAGERKDRLVRNLDVFATLLTLAGVDVPAHVDGRDLLADRTDAPEYVHLSTFYRANRGRDVTVDDQTIRVATGLRGIRTRRWKLVVGEPVLAHDGPRDPGDALPDAYVAAHRQVSLYDLKRDPQELDDVAREHPLVLRRLLALLERQEGRGSAATPARAPLTPDARDRLRALGYLEDDGA